MRTFIPQDRVPFIADNQTVQSSFCRSAQIAFQLRDINILIAICNIHPVVIVKQQGTVMIKTFHIALFPGTFYAVCRVQVCSVGVIGNKTDIVNAFVTAQRSRPHTLSVDIFLPLKPLSGSTIQPVINICHMLPVTQIIRAQNLTPRHKMHGSAHHIISIVYADHIRIRIIQPGDRINMIIFHVPV